MSVFIESHIEFDFTHAVSAAAHDERSGGQGNNIWNGVDFCLQDGAEQLWLEVKSWNAAHIDPRNRGGSRRSFLSKMKSKVFTQEMRNKFIGTTAFLAWTNNFTPAPTRYVLLFQPPHALDAALLVTFQNRIKSQVPNPRVWQQPIYVAVLDLDEWNRRYPEYPARLL